MKKTGLITLITVTLATLLLSSCGTSLYFESWFNTKGYVVKDAEGDFDSFVKGTNGKPDGTPKAIMWDHAYERRLRCTLTAQKWELLDDIEWGNIESPYVFTITSTPREINGLIFYCDSQNVYVINNKYDEYVDADYSPSNSNPNYYRFKIEISGIRPLEFIMRKKNGSGSW